MSCSFLLIFSSFRYRFTFSEGKEHCLLKSSQFSSALPKSTRTLKERITKEEKRMDPTWEFQAPQFVDFTQLDGEAEDRKVDQFFDVDMESGQLWTTASEEEGVSGGLTASRTVASSLVPRVNKPSNLVTSWAKGAKLESSCRTQQPAKKRRRLSNAILQTVLASSGNNNQHQQKAPSRRKIPASILGYKSAGTPKRLKTNVVRPRLSNNFGKTKGSDGQKMKQTIGPTTITIPKPFKLSTELRAEERKVFEEKKKKENLILEGIKQREKEREEREREAQISHYRKTLIHKPQPIKTFKCVEIKRSDKQLTRPESPKFVTKKVRCKLSK